MAPKERIGGPGRKDGGGKNESETQDPRELRGKNAEGPAGIPAPGWKQILVRIYRQTGEDHISLIAAGIAFYALLALFPGIAASVAIAGLASEPAAIVARMRELAQILPEQAAEIIFNQAQAVAGSREGGLGLAAVVGILLALYSASRGVHSLVEGLNVAYDEEEKRGFVKLYATVFGMTLLLIAALFIAILTTVVVPSILAFLQLDAKLEILAFILQWALLLALASLGLALVYRYGPSRETAKWRWVTPGAVIACLLWIAASVLFAVYVRNFGSYNETFGSLAGVVVLLMWLWLSAYSVLLGAEIDAEMEAQTARDSTTGRPLPRGRRGAIKADYLPGEEVPEPADERRAPAKAAPDANRLPSKEEDRNQTASSRLSRYRQEIAMHSVFYTIGVVVVVLFAITLIA